MCEHTERRETSARTSIQNARVLVCSLTSMPILLVLVNDFARARARDQMLVLVKRVLVLVA